MCGIAGFIGHHTLPKPRVDATLERMRNRGPDAQGCVELVDGPTVVTLLHSRLSIIDLDARANQPFRREGATIVFNGEIYNYIERRDELRRMGCEFTTDSDTEVLVQSWLTRGERFAEELEGMWSFALYDCAKHQLVLSRDRFGEKPLYLHRTQEGTYFASEIKFLESLAGKKLRVREDQIYRFLVYGYRALHHRTGRTFFEEVEELLPATHCFIDSSLTEQRVRYWKPVYAPVEMSIDDAVAGVRHHLQESVRLRLRSDVPMAFCLSGGIDSGSIVSLATKVLGHSVSAYSIVDSDERYDEQLNIQATVNDTGCEWTPIHVTGERSLDRLGRLVAYHDAPVYTSSYYVHSFLSERINRDGRRVAFSGTGADELFTGYYDHFHYQLYDLRNDPSKFREALEDWRRYIHPVCRNPHLQDPQRFLDDPSFRDNLRLDAEVFREYLVRDFSEPFEEERASSSLLRSRMLNEIGFETVPPILHEDDLNSMLYSIENRSPYLDSKLCEFAMTIPVSILIRHGYGKYLLREAMKGVLNEAVRTARQKKGFNADILSVFELSHGGLRELLLNDSPLYRYVRREKVESVLSLDSYPNSFSKFVFSLISVKLFLEQHD